MCCNHHMRHLTSSQAQSALRRGKQIEQYLGGVDDVKVGTIRWLTLALVDGTFRLTLHHVEEPTSQSTLDLAELEPVDHNEYVGEGRPICEVATWQDATVEAERLGATDNRWVNQGLVGDEYSDDASRGQTEPG